MRKAVVSGVLIAGLAVTTAFAGTAMAAPAAPVNSHEADFKALHQQRQTIMAEMRQNPAQAQALVQQLHAIRQQEMALRKSVRQARQAALKQNAKNRRGGQ